MRKLFVIGGMGAGKSTVCEALVEEGLPYIDLDDVSHDVLHEPRLKDDLIAAFGQDILNDDDEIDRTKLAAIAFESPELTAKLNELVLPAVLEAHQQALEELQSRDHEAAVIECSTFRNREMMNANPGDMVLAVKAPLEDRIERKTAMGFDRQDVERRIARQISDEERSTFADVEFLNDGSREALRHQVLSWWEALKDAEQSD